MKRIISIITILYIGQFLFAQEYQLNLNDSKASWIGYAEIGKFQQSGTMEFSNGTIQMKEGKIINGSIELDMHTLNCEDKKLKKHLKAKDFFDVKNFPKANFVLSSWEDNIAHGKLEMKGIVQEISFPIQFEVKGNKVKMEGKAIIDRTLFGIKYNSSSYFQDLGSYAIKNEVDFKFKLHFVK